MFSRSPFFRPPRGPKVRGRSKPRTALNAPPEQTGATFPRPRFSTRPLRRAGFFRRGRGSRKKSFNFVEEAVLPALLLFFGSLPKLPQGWVGVPSPLGAARVFPAFGNLFGTAQRFSKTPPNPTFGPKTPGNTAAKHGSQLSKKMFFGGRRSPRRRLRFWRRSWGRPGL